MPLYEGRHNAENVIKISPEAKNAITFTANETVDRIYSIINAAEGAVALDGWYGVDYAATGITMEKLGVPGCDPDEINAYLNSAK